jgi:hypothetical protein
MTSLCLKKGRGGSGEIGRRRGAVPAAAASCPAKGRHGPDNTRPGRSSGL